MRIEAAERLIRRRRTITIRLYRFCDRKRAIVGIAAIFDVTDDISDVSLTMSKHPRHELAGPLGKPKSACSGCASVKTDPPAIAFALQPIVDMASRTTFACEALVRGVNGESAHSVLSRVDDQDRYRFDQLCRTKAIAQAAELGMDSFLSINFMPNAVYRPESCIQSTLAAADQYGFPITRIIFETVEGENIVDRPHLVEIFKAYKRFGFQTAIDDFGSGYSGLALLVDFQPDFIKLDMELVRGIDADKIRQRIVCGVLKICRDLGVAVIAEGIETRQERDFLMAHGVALMQGYFFAKPAFQSIPLLREESFT